MAWHLFTRDELRTLPWEAYRPNRWFVYALYRKDQLIYIGRTVRLRDRISCHRGRGFDVAKVSECKTKQAQWQRERRLISRLCPGGNVQFRRSSGRQLMARKRLESA